MGVGGGAVRLWWEVWAWDPAAGISWMDVSVVAVGETEDAEDACERLWKGVWLMARDLAPGSTAMESSSPEIRTQHRGWHARVRVSFAGDDLGMFEAFETGLERVAWETRS
jgi:hypothetical protein